jgi:hypothetical protein
MAKDYLCYFATNASHQSQNLRESRVCRGWASRSYQPPRLKAQKGFHEQKRSANPQAEAQGGVKNDVHY